MAYQIETEAQRKGKFALHVALNGTAENPYHKQGLTMNPFPQLAKMELAWADRALAILAADPIPHATYREYIRNVLMGATAEFIDLCIEKFRPGAYVRFTVYIPSSRP